MAFTPKQMTETYNAYAREYDEKAVHNRWMGPQYVATLVGRYLAPAEPGPMLDVGTGTGLVGEFVRRSHPNLFIHGIDLSGGMLDIALQKKRVNVITYGNVTQLLFRDRKFKATTACGVLNYVDDIGAAFKQMVRVTQPGGPIVVTCQTTFGDGRVPVGLLHNVHSFGAVMDAIEVAGADIVHHEDLITRYRIDQPVVESLIAAVAR